MCRKDSMNNNNISFEKYGIHETAAIGLRVILHIVINGYGETVSSLSDSNKVGMNSINEFDIGYNDECDAIVI